MQMIISENKKLLAGKKYMFFKATSGIIKTTVFKML